MRCDLLDFELPDYQSENYFNQLLAFGRFLEQHTRAACKFDLMQNPNPLWLKIEKSLLESFSKFVQTNVDNNEILILQWYNSGIFIKSPKITVGLDILPVPRFFGWKEPENLTTKIANNIDVLAVSHEHEDHYDKDLVSACVKLNKPVLSHKLAQLNQLGYVGMSDNESLELLNTKLVCHHTCHVWRDTFEELACCTFEVIIHNDIRIVFCGDSDYTKSTPTVSPKADMLFITWRNPGPKYEDGHPEQTSTSLDALKIATKSYSPSIILLQHYAELAHVYKGFAASYDHAINLIKKAPLSVKLLFWGNQFSFKKTSLCQETS